MGFLLMLVDSLTLLILITMGETSTDGVNPFSPVWVWMGRGWILGTGLGVIFSSLRAWGLRGMVLFLTVHSLFHLLLCWPRWAGDDCMMGSHVTCAPCDG